MKNNYAEPLTGWATPRTPRQQRVADAVAHADRPAADADTPAPTSSAAAGAQDEQASAPSQSSDAAAAGAEQSPAEQPSVPAKPAVATPPARACSPLRASADFTYQSVPSGRPPAASPKQPPAAPSHQIKFTTCSSFKTYHQRREINHLVEGPQSSAASSAFPIAAPPLVASAPTAEQASVLAAPEPYSVPWPKRDPVGTGHGSYRRSRTVRSYNKSRPKWGEGGRNSSNPPPKTNGIHGEDQSWVRGCWDIPDEVLPSNAKARVQWHKCSSDV